MKRQSSRPSGDPATSIHFAEAARQLSDQARGLGLLVPAFRSPPRIVGLTRTIRKRADGSVSVAVAFKNRPWSAVLADMIEGVVAGNELTGAVAARARDDLWQAVEVSVAAEAA